MFIIFLQITSGHHHVVQTLIRELSALAHKSVCYNVDILSYSYGHLEKVVSSAYLGWIKRLPRVYDWIYQRLAYKPSSQENNYKLYDLMFTRFLMQLINRKNPHIIFCTHAIHTFS